MRTRKVALTVYIVSSLLAIIAAMLDDDVLILLAKPAVIPAIFFYYLSIKRRQAVDSYIVLILLLSFVGDTILLLEIEDTKIIMIPYFLSYLILFRFVIMDVQKIKFHTSGLLLSALIFVFLMAITYALIQLLIDTNGELVWPVIIYGMMFSTLASFSGYCYFMGNNTAFLYLAIAVLMSIVSDVFYIMFSLIFHFQSFKYLEFSMQMFSYFFIVKYCVLRKNSFGELNLA
jgi:uncharacterized membrane protein YhhN